MKINICAIIFGNSDNFFCPDLERNWVGTVRSPYHIIAPESLGPNLEGNWVGTVRSPWLNGNILLKSRNYYGICKNAARVLELGGGVLARLCLASVGWWHHTLRCRAADCNSQIVIVMKFLEAVIVTWRETWQAKFLLHSRTSTPL